jgi:hypothetical protein
MPAFSLALWKSVCCRWNGLGARAAIEWGVYGVPETFIVGRDGKIAYKHVGRLPTKPIRL